jgi:WD40 repeat protein
MTRFLTTTVFAMVALSALADGAAPAAGRPVLALKDVAQAAFSPDGRVLMTVSGAAGDRQAHFWSAETGEEVNRFGVAVVGAVFSGDGSRVMTWGDDRVVRIFDARTGKALRRLDGVIDVRGGAAAIAPDGSRVLTAGVNESALVLWDAGTGKALGTLAAHTSAVTGVAFSPDGGRAVSLGGDGPAPAGPPQGWIGKRQPPATTRPADVSLRLWDLGTLKEIHKTDLPAPGHSPYFAANGKLVLVSVAQGVRLIDPETGETVPTPRSPDETFPAGQATPDRKVALRKAIGQAVLVDAATGNEIRPLAGPIDGLPLCNAFSRDAARVACGTGTVSLFTRKENEPGRAYVHDVASGKRLAALDGHAAQVVQVAFAADGRHLFSRDSSKALLLWHVP